MPKQKIVWSSILIGILTFGLLGFSVYNVLVRLGFMQVSQIYYLFISIGAIYGAYLGYKTPVKMELISFGITLLIAIQAYWDSAYDIQQGLAEPRVLTGAIAIGIFLLNTFTGTFRKGTAKKQLRKLLGLR